MMVRLINPEDWFLVLIVLEALISFPLLIAITAFIFKIPFVKIFNQEIGIIFLQLSGIVLFTFLLIQVSVNSDGMGANLIYGRF
jgi:hypothetical protein